MRKYAAFLKSDYGRLDPKVDLNPDFFTGFEPSRRKEIVTAEAGFYHSITEKYSVDDKLDKHYVEIMARDGVKIPVKVYRPLDCDENLPALLFMHGGGFITCSPETHDFVPSYIAANAKVMCFNVDYRLAPEYKFPKGIEDCWDAAKWIFENAEKLKVDKDRISVGGDSSGGNFTAVLTHMAKDSGEISFYKQVLIYPATDFSGKIPKKSAQIYAPVGGGDESAVPGFLMQYLPENVMFDDPAVSPLLREDFSGLPKALFIQAECDSLCDDGLYYAKCLSDDGVEVKCEIYKGMPHAFILRTYEETFKALDSICEFLKD